MASNFDLAHSVIAIETEINAELVYMIEANPRASKTTPIFAMVCQKE